MTKEEPGAIEQLPEPIHVVRTDTSTAPVCTCDQYPGAFNAHGQSAQHERGCAYHNPPSGAQWEAYKREPHLVAFAREQDRRYAALVADRDRLRTALEKTLSMLETAHRAFDRLTDRAAKETKVSSKEAEHIEVKRHPFITALLKRLRRISRSERDAAEALVAINENVLVAIDLLEAIDGLDRFQVAQNVRIYETIKQLGVDIMGELEDAQAAVAAVKADVANVQTKIADLQQQIADLIAGQGDVASLKAGLAQIATDLTGVNSDLDAVAPDAPPVP